MCSAESGDSASRLPKVAGAIALVGAAGGYYYYFHGEGKADPNKASLRTPSGKDLRPLAPAPWGIRKRWGRNHLSFRANRSAASRALVSDSEVVLMGKLINDLVDLDCWSEEQEKELFEHAVAQCLEPISKVLPPPFHDMLHGWKGCLDDDSAAELSKRLVQLCIKECSFPFLDEQDSRRIIRCVSEVLLTSMRHGHTLERYLKLLNSDEKARNDVVLEVFIKGAMDVFFDEDLRAALVEDVVDALPEVPLLPSSLFERVASKIISIFGGLLQDCLKEAYIEYKEAVFDGVPLAQLPPALQGSESDINRVQRNYPNQPFLIQLRRTIVEKIMNQEKDWLGLPEKTKARIICGVVDIMFQCLPGLDKIENTVQPFHGDLEGGQ